MFNEKIESQILGNAMVIFGGKIIPMVGEIIDAEYPHVVVSFKETSEQYEVGSIINHDEDLGDPEVSLVFDKVESIECVQTQLELAKQDLMYKIHGEKYIRFSRLFSEIANTVVIDGMVTKTREDEFPNIVSEIIHKNDIIIQEKGILYCYFKDEHKYRIESIISELNVCDMDCGNYIKLM